MELSDLHLPRYLGQFHTTESTTPAQRATRKTIINNICDILLSMDSAKIDGLTREMAAEGINKHARTSNVPIRAEQAWQPYNNYKDGEFVASSSDSYLKK